MEPLGVYLAFFNDASEFRKVKSDHQTPDEHSARHYGCVRYQAGPLKSVIRFNTGLGVNLTLRIDNGRSWTSPLFAFKHNGAGYDRNSHQAPINGSRFVRPLILVQMYHMTENPYACGRKVKYL